MNSVLLIPGWFEREHVYQCGCQLLAAAVDTGASAVDFSYCRHVLH